MAAARPALTLPRELMPVRCPLTVEVKVQVLCLLTSLSTSSINCEFLDYFYNKDFRQLKCPCVFLPASEGNHFVSVETK